MPELPLPEYNHASGECLDSFLYKFETTIAKHNLSEYEKYLYLKRQLKGEPLTLVNSLDVSKQSYSEAVALLKQAFADASIQKFNVIDKLSKLKIEFESL